MDVEVMTEASVKALDAVKLRLEFENAIYLNSKGKEVAANLALMREEIDRRLALVPVSTTAA